MEIEKFNSTLETDFESASSTSQKFSRYIDKFNR